VEDLLPAPDARTIADALYAHSGGVVIVHGPAGAGKTTAFQQVGGHLPPESTVVLFDCYGGGEYLSSGGVAIPSCLPKC
jgi:ABC-type hemin transport system ATPase subunit